MDVLGDAIARERRSDATALTVPKSGRRYDYRRFCTSAWKTAHVLRHIGVRSGVGVAIADDPVPEPLLTFYGAATLGAIVTFGPPAEIESETRALVVPTAETNAYSFGAETKQIAYGGPPDDPSVSYFERDVWSENPTAPPDHIEPDQPLFRSTRKTYTHGDALRAAHETVDEYRITTDSTVAVQGSFTDPTVVIAGCIAPIVAGAHLSIGPGASGDVIVGGRDSDIDAIEPK